MIKAFIIEDESRGLENLKNLISAHCPEVEVIGEARNLKDGLSLLSSTSMNPDVAFMDINLPDGLVFSLLTQLNHINFDIIFVTAFENFAIKACEFSAIGYVMKPIDPDQLIEAVGRIRKEEDPKTAERMELFDSIYRNPNAFEKLSISAVDGIYFVNLKDIVRLEADDNYTHIFLKDNHRITASKTIKSYGELLESVNFFRVHKRHVVNLNFMQKFVKGDGGYIVMDDGKEIEVSRRRRPAFIEQIRALQANI
ncbi:MAG: LytTR family DNA-binding domain-containing protein [Bacteroidia bacterium]|nr:LytTR family DNA-binding domain-containing protein [Bacteroidia bacterium]